MILKSSSLSSLEKTVEYPQSNSSSPKMQVNLISYSAETSIPEKLWENVDDPLMLDVSRTSRSKK